jgi:hypothetical protein
MLDSDLVGARGREQKLELSSTIHEPSTIHEHAQSNRACNIFSFAVLDFLYNYLSPFSKVAKTNVYTLLMVFVNFNRILLSN